MKIALYYTLNSSIRTQGILSYAFNFNGSQYWLVIIVCLSANFYIRGIIVKYSILFNFS